MWLKELAKGGAVWALERVGAGVCHEVGERLYEFGRKIGRKVCDAVDRAVDRIKRKFGWDDSKGCALA